MRSANPSSTEADVRELRALRQTCRAEHAEALPDPVVGRPIPRIRTRDGFRAKVARFEKPCVADALGQGRRSRAVAKRLKLGQSTFVRKIGGI